MSRIKGNKRPRLWTPSDLARVANHLRKVGYEEELIYFYVRNQEKFTLDDTARALEPQISLIREVRNLRRMLKLIAALLAVVVALTGGAAATFIIPLEAELMAVIIALGIFAAELRRLKKYVLEVRHIIGTDRDDSISMPDMPTDEEIDETIKEADNLAAKINKLIDGLDVIFD